MARVLLDLQEGRVAGALLENGLLGRLTGAGSEVLVVTPAAGVPSFVERHGGPGVELRSLPTAPGLSSGEKLHRQLDRRLARRGFGPLRRGLWRWAERLALRLAGRERELVRAWRPDVVVVPHVFKPYSRCLVAAAHAEGVPTLGNLFSWDNAYRGFNSRPGRLTCWSEHNRTELGELWGYPPERVEAIGAPALDAYLADDGAWSRERLCRELGLDPARPILLFASLGQFNATIDETNPLEVLLRGIDSGEIPGEPQVVLRLHPASRKPYFAALTGRPDVIVSRYESYVPGLSWYPERREMILAGNLFRHADACISPGSTVTLECAIFDTPTLVPVFNEYMPEEYERFFRAFWLERHFRMLVEEDLLILSRSAGELLAHVRRALAEPDRFRAERARIRERFLEPLDGRATERFAQAILGCAGEGAR
jgi:hypothetical protein